MNVTHVLATALFCLVCYVLARDPIINRKAKGQSKKTKHIREYIANLDLPHKIEFFSIIIFVGLCIWLLFTNFPVALTVFSIPSIIIYALVLVFTLVITCKVVISGGRTQLKPLETNSLAFLGIVFSLLGFTRSTKYNTIYLDGTASIGNIALLAVEYSAYLFFIFSLAFLLISDCCRLIMKCGMKLSTKFSYNQRFCSEECTSSHKGVWAFDQACDRLQNKR